MTVDDLAFWATAILSIRMFFLYMGDCYFVPTYDLFVYFFICGIGYFFATNAFHIIFNTYIFYNFCTSNLKNLFP